MILLRSQLVSKDVEQRAAYGRSERAISVCSLDPFLAFCFKCLKLALVGVNQHTTAEDLASCVLLLTKNTPESSFDTTQLHSPYQNWKNSFSSPPPSNLLLFGNWGGRLGGSGL